MADPQARDDLAQIEEGADGGVTVNLDGKKGGADQGRTGPDGRRQPSGDENVEALKEQLARERQARIDAQNHSKQLDTRRVQAEQQSVSGQLNLIESSITSTNSEKASLKNELAAAHAAGEYEKVADLTEKLNDSQIRLRDLTFGRDQLKQRSEQERANGGRVQEHQRQEPDDPVEAFIANAGVSRRSADWLREHPECITDPRKQRETARAHEDAVYEGISPDTRAYFEFIEEKMGIGNGSHRDDAGDRGRARDDRVERRSGGRSDDLAGNAAPPSRGGSDGRGARSNSVTLSATEKAFCDDTNMDYAVYARNKIALQKEGKLR